MGGTRGVPQPIRITDLSPGPYTVTLTLVDHDLFPVADMLSSLLQPSGNLVESRRGRGRDVAAAAEVKFFVVSEDGAGAPPVKASDKVVPLPLRVPDGTITAIRTRNIGEKTWTEVEGGDGNAGARPERAEEASEGAARTRAEKASPTRIIRCKLKEEKMGRKMIVSTSDELVSELAAKVAKVYGAEDKSEVKLYDGEGYEIETSTSLSPSGLTVGTLAAISGADGGDVLYLDVRVSRSE